jgi:CRISPR/Cas system-associated endonuclease Cas3-HD
VATDGARSMIRKKTGSMNRIRREMDKNVPNVSWNFTASSTNSRSVKKTLKLEHVMKVVVSVVNFIQSYVLSYYLFESFLSQIDAKYGNFLYHT